MKNQSDRNTKLENTFSIVISFLFALGAGFYNFKLLTMLGAEDYAFLSAIITAALVIFGALAIRIHLKIQNLDDEKYMIENERENNVHYDITKL